MSILFPTASRTTLYKDPVTVQAPIIFSLPNSGSKFTVGWRANDIYPAPASGSLCFPSGSLINGDYTTPVTPIVTTNYSIGVKTNVSGSFSAVHLFDNGTYPGLYFSGSNQRVDVYTAIYQNSWLLCATAAPISRTLWSGSIYRTIVETPIGCAGLYLKLHFADGPLMDSIGSLVSFTQIEVYERVSTGATSGSYYRPYNSGPVNTGPTGVSNEIVLRGASF